MTHILVVDPNEAFATLLVEELQREGYTVTSTHAYEAALQAAQKHTPDLAVLDMGIDDPGAIALAQALRAKLPSLRLILIPLMGEDLSSEAAGGIMIQGVLSKPFFLPELPERIEAALSAPLTGSAGAKSSPQPEPAPEPEPSPEPDLALAAVGKAESAPPPVIAEAGGGLSSKLLARHRAEVQGLMNVLEQEVAADAVLLTVGNQLSVWVGHLEQAEVTAIAQAAIQGWKTSAEVARILGREQVRFEQSIAGGDYMLYALGVDTNAILAVVVRGMAPLGLLRHRARETADKIATMCAE